VIIPQPSAGYAHLAGILREQILTGQLAPGQPLPSETRLQQEHGLARQTVRRAVMTLRTEGLVTYVRGVGVFVREDAAMQDLVPGAGSTVTARMPTGEERAELDLAEGVPVFQVVDPTGRSRIFPADRWRLRWPS
jgi:DNA-binding GntR family transcriptional regulator